MFIENVDWQITSRCNRKCPYCYGPKNIRELPLSDAKRIVDILAEKGARQIGITGGEPLLYPQISELTEYIVGKGIKIYLSSNCDHYGEFAQLIKDNVSILGVPLDGASAAVHDSIRDAGSFRSITSAIADIYASSSDIKVKVGTVLVNGNASEPEKIEKLLSQYKEKILYWKLYELIVYARNKASAMPLQTTYDKSRYALGRYLGASKVIYDTIEERDRSYFFLKPDGEVFTPFLNHEESVEKHLGNILEDDIEDIMRTFAESVNAPGYNRSYRYMHNSDDR